MNPKLKNKKIIDVLLHLRFFKLNTWLIRNILISNIYLLLGFLDIHRIPTESYIKIQPIKIKHPMTKCVKIISYVEQELLLEAYIHFSYFYLLNKILTWQKFSEKSFYFQLLLLFHKGMCISIFGSSFRCIYVLL